MNSMIKKIIGVVLVVASVGTSYAATDRYLDVQYIRNRAFTLTVPTVNGTLVERAAVETLSNKTINGTLIGPVTGNVTGNASTATALAANPSDCSAGQYANAIAASGNLTCSAIASSDLSAVVLGTTNGGTGQNNRTAAFNALAPSSPAKGTLVVFNGSNWVNVGVGSEGSLLRGNSSSSAGVDWASATSGSSQTSMIIMDSGNGHGGSVSGDTKIRNFSNSRVSSGSDITYTARTTTAGDKFTANTAGVFCVEYTDQNSGAAESVAITVNDSATSTNATTPITYAQGLRALGRTGSTNEGSVSWCGILAATDVVRAHDDGGSNSTNSKTLFTIVKVSN